MKKNCLIFYLLFISHAILSQKHTWTGIEKVPDASFRGLSVVDDHVAWVSGTKGWIGQTVNGGKNWQFSQVKGFEKYDFRSLYAFDAKTAIIANAGSPAFILMTKDGGTNWSIVHKNEHKDAFFDGIDFWNSREGIIHGDPINGRMLLLTTDDGGSTWKDVASAPILNEGEACFAASGTAIRCYKKNKVTIVTGGKVSQLLVSDDKGENWRFMEVPMIQGQSTTGTFSVAFKNEKEGAIVGGDYQKDLWVKNHVFYTKNGGKNWHSPIKPTGGFRECVEYIAKNTLIAIGPGGADISYDGGAQWQLLSDEKGFHVLRKSRKGKLIMCAGNGKISVLR